MLPVPFESFFQKTLIFFEKTLDFQKKMWYNNQAVKIAGVAQW